MTNVKLPRVGSILPWLLCLTVIRVGIAFAEGPALAEPETAAALETQPSAATAPAPGDGHASRIASNFAALMSGSWMDIALFAGATILWGVIWAVGLFFLGIIVGLTAWLLLRRRALAAPWRWYRYVGWLWAVIFILSAAIGFAYAGAWLGPGRHVKQAIRQHRLIDRIVCNLYFAAVLDKAEYQATGKESAEDMQKVLADSEGLAKLAVADYEALRDEAVAGQADGAVERWVMRLAADTLTDKLGEKLSGLDPRVVLAFCWPGANTQAYIETHPDAEPLVAAVATHFGEVRRRACSLVDAAVMPHMIGGFGIGLGGPLGLAGIFYVTVVLVGRRGGQRI